MSYCKKFGFQLEGDINLLKDCNQGNGVINLVVVRRMVVKFINEIDEENVVVIEMRDDGGLSQKMVIEMEKIVLRDI